MKNDLKAVISDEDPFTVSLSLVTAGLALPRVAEIGNAEPNYLSGRTAGLAPTGTPQLRFQSL
jgi:hypothetical protein